jgi:hypothetical protein
MRTFESGATRNVDDDKIDFDGFLSPLALRRYAEYLHKHRHQADGKLRDSDNWQKGIPKSAYMKSLWRHFIDAWTLHRGCATISEQSPDELIEDALCATIFNAMGYLHEHLKRDKSIEEFLAIDLPSNPKSIPCECANCNPENPATDGRRHYLL